MTNFKRIRIKNKISLNSFVDMTFKRYLKNIKII